MLFSDITSCSAIKMLSKLLCLIVNTASVSLVCVKGGGGGNKIVPLDHCTSLKGLWL